MNGEGQEMGIREMRIKKMEIKEKEIGEKEIGEKEIKEKEMGEQENTARTYGIGVVKLGKETKRKEVGRGEADCGEAEEVILDTFYSAGGRETIVKTKAGLSYDRENLYVSLTCFEDAPRVLRPSDGNRNEMEWMKRDDLVEVVLASGTFSQRDYCVFRVRSSGEGEAHRENGMTYHGGDHAILDDQFTEKNEAKITEIPSASYQFQVKEEEKKWSAHLTLPWELFGGYPGEGGCFRFQIYRKKNQTNEVLALTPLDLNSNYENKFDYDPETFLEAYPGGEAGVEYANCACVILPSGIMHWQRPATLQWPSSACRKKILALQKSQEKTTEANLADRIVTLQSWQDVLILEGADFFPNSRCENSFPKVDPWVQRRLCNEALRRKDMREACLVLDELLSYYKTFTAWWYADGTLGNADEDNWDEFALLQEVKEGENGVLLIFLTDGTEGSATLLPQERGARFYVEKEGDYKSGSVPFRLLLSKEEAVVETKHSRITIRTGKNWEIRIDQKFILNKENLRLYRNGGRFAFDIRQQLLPDEMVYGFGERFDAVNQRGKVLTLWQRDAFEGCGCSIGNQSYKNVSFFHSTAGYALFINSFYRIRVDAGKVYEGLRISTMGDKTDFTVFTGTAQENMEDYTLLTGKPLLPPDWVFEPWAGGGVGRWMDGPTGDVVKEMEGVLNRFRNLDIPHSGLYAEGAGWRFGDRYHKEEPYQITAFAHQRGVRVFSWQFSHIDEEEAASYLPDCLGEELPITRTPGYGGKRKLPSEIDFSHPRAMELLEAQWKDRMDAGMDGTMVDFGEITPDEALFFDGRRGDEMHNAYAVEYTKAYRQLFTKYRGEDHVLYSRSASAGTQHYACQFGGDQLSGFRGLTYSINGGVTAGSSGLPFWGVDAGGYDGLCDEESYLRWTEFAAFCPIMRYHGTRPREPWIYSDYAVRLYRYYAWLRENLLPYSIETGEKAHRTGMPMMRPLPMMFPEDERARAYGDEYLYGDSLLVAPVHEEGEEREIYFPKGRWVNLFDFQETVSGPKTLVKKVPISRIPVYVKEGAFLPLFLNGDLHLGESMTYEKEKVMLISLPAEEERSSSYQAEGDRLIQKTKEGIHILLRQARDLHYVILLGLSQMEDVGSEISSSESDLTGEDDPKAVPMHRREFSAIEVNGRTLRRASSVNDLRYGEGFYLRGDGSVVLRVMPEEEVYIFWKK